MGAAKCHEHFLLFPRNCVHATFPAPAICHAISMCQGTKLAPTTSLTLRERLICGVAPLTVVDFNQRMSASHCLGLKLYMNKRSMWPSNSSLSKEGNSWALWHPFRTDTTLTMNEVALLLPDEKGVSHC